MFRSGNASCDSFTGESQNLLFFAVDLMSKPITEQKVFLKIAASSLEVSFDRNLWVIVLVWNQRVKCVNVKSVFNFYSAFWLVVFPILAIICSLKPLSISCWHTATRMLLFYSEIESSNLYLLASRCRHDLLLYSAGCLVDTVATSRTFFFCCIG